MGEPLRNISEFNLVDHGHVYSSKTLFQALSLTHTHTHMSTVQNKPHFNIKPQTTLNGNNSYMCLPGCVYACVRESVCVYVCMCVCVCVHVCACVCVCVSFISPTLL